MRYEFAPDVQQKLKQIVEKLGFDHVVLDSVLCYRSYGTSTRTTIARCHALGKLMQKALGRKGFYALEFISERFDNLLEEDKIKTLIHELMHIPKSFGGGFRHHDYVCKKNIDKLYKEFIKPNFKNFEIQHTLK